MILLESLSDSPVRRWRSNGVQQRRGASSFLTRDAALNEVTSCGF